MIDERQQEQASLYVLGALAADEAAAFEAALRRDPELQRLVTALRDSAGALAGTVPRVNPPPALKQRILDEIDRREKIVPLTPSVAPARSPVAWLPWALAACFAILCSIFLIQRETMRNELTELNRINRNNRVVYNELLDQVARLTNEFASLRIATLNTLLPESPNATAVAVWNEKSQDGVLQVQNLAPLPQDKDYQLWIVDPNYKDPVDAGVFQVDARGSVRYKFNAKQPVSSANKFAVSLEKKGGVPKAEGKMVLLGG